MLTEWNKFRGWSVLQYFLEHPTERIGTNELARRLRISPLTATTYLSLYAQQGLLESAQIANVRQRALNNNDARVLLLKQFYALQKIKECGFAEKAQKSAPAVSHIVLYGSYADGTYTKNSDVDLLIIAPAKLPAEAFRCLESALGAEVGLTAMTYGQWRKAVKAKNSFTMSVLKNHKLLLGAEL